mgnify:CR=1 FL=1
MIDIGILLTTTQSTRNILLPGFSGDFWLGGRKIRGQGYPPQRIAADLMLWEPGQLAHGGDCLQMIARSDGKVRWDDHGCSNLKHFICEKA